MRTILVALAALLLVIVRVFSAAQQEAGEKGQINVGFNAMNVSMTWMVFAKEAMEQAADEIGMKLIILDSENDVSRQAAKMEDLVSLGVDEIITDPIDANSLTPAINKAAEEGVPTATFDRAAIGADYAFYVGCDDVEGGRLVADFVADKLGGKGKVIFITGTPGSSPARDREKGFKEQLKSHPGLEIAFEQTGEFFREKGMQIMEDAITAVPDFDAVPDGLRAVRDDLADATVQYPVGQAAEVLKRVASFLEGNPPVEKDFEMLPWIITKDNLDSGDFYKLIANE